MASIINLRILARSIIQIVIFMSLLHIASASGNDISELKQQLSFFDDPKITVLDLAFYLATHNYEATPKDGYVELKLNGTIYKLIPNGNKQGLCDILPTNVSSK